jgi:phospho-N-acetylmuramoyl-pentapeptide-transferase
MSAANVFHYVSFRAMAALLTSLGLALIFGSWFISFSQRLFRSKSRPWTPESHRAKDDMPTMGGIFILFTAIASCLLWCDLADPRVWVCFMALCGFGLIGFWDDWGKIKSHRGISAKAKFLAQWSLAFAIVIFWLWSTQTPTTITLPFLKNFNPDIGIFFIFWAAFIIVSCSNAVNLTDGLDGLAIGSLIPNFATFTLICYLAGHIKIADYLNIPFVACAEVAIVGAALVGASLGFLWYNAYPAQIFMGDVGSLALGACLAMMALICKQELLLAITGGLFVLETASVIMQVFMFKRFKRRIFKMAPIHHHFELLGWPEAKITVRFAIISLILCLIALVTLKIR